MMKTTFKQKLVFKEPVCTEGGLVGLGSRGTKKEYVTKNKNKQKIPHAYQLVYISYGLLISVLISCVSVDDFVLQAACGLFNIIH